MKILYLFILIMIHSPLARASENHLTFEQMPILHEGRVKPLDTFARITLKRILQKDSLKGTTPSEWLAEVLFNPVKAYQTKIFKINNPDLKKILVLEKRESHLYSFIEVYTALNNITEQVEKLLLTAEADRTPDQKQLVTLHANAYYFLTLSRTFSMFFPEFTFSQSDLAESLNLPVDKKLSFFELKEKDFQLKYFIQQKMPKKGSKPSASFINAFKAMNFLQDFSQESFAEDFRVLFSEKNKDWQAPWEMDLTKSEDFYLLEPWFKFFKSYSGAPSTLLKLQTMKTNSFVSSTKLQWETLYNRFKLFNAAFILYLISFLTSVTFLLTNKKFLIQMGFYSLCLGAVAHASNLAIRCYLMARPPVSNLYESILFVALVGVAFSIIMAKRERGKSTLIGSILGSVLLLISFGYEKDGDSLGMLVAVLDTNFWLSTHVLTISIGYGTSLITSLLAHLFLFEKFVQNKGSSQELKKLIHYCSLLSLFFVILGTMLGGIWADQSWGRFWGWDPKENGALLICLWLLWVIHGKISGILKENLYMLLVAITGIIVILAWFGVNLLNVGLHSYGFTDNIAYNIVFYILAEFLIFSFFIFKMKVRT